MSLSLDKIRQLGEQSRQPPVTPGTVGAQPSTSDVTAPKTGEPATPLDRVIAYLADLYQTVMEAYELTDPEYDEILRGILGDLIAQGKVTVPPESDADTKEIENFDASIRACDLKAAVLARMESLADAVDASTPLS